MSERILEDLSPEERAELEQKTRDELAETVIRNRDFLRADYPPIHRLLSALPEIGLDPEADYAVASLKDMVTLCKALSQKLPRNNVFDLGPNAPGPASAVPGEEAFVEGEQ